MTSIKSLLTYLIIICAPFMSGGMVAYIEGGTPTPTATPPAPTATPTASPTPGGEGMSSLMLAGTEHGLTGSGWTTPPCDAATDCYLSFGSIRQAPATALNAVQSYVPVAGAFTNFQVVLSNDVGTSGDNFYAELIVNGSVCSPALSCAILGDAGSETSCSLDTSECPVSVGDLVAWEVYTEGTPAAVRAQWSVEFIADNAAANESMIVMSTAIALPTVGIEIMALQGHSSSVAPVSSWQQTTIAAVEGDISDFGCDISIFPGVGRSRIFEVMKACDVAPVSLTPALTCTIADTSTNCGPDTDSAPFTEGEHYCIEQTLSGEHDVAAYATCGVKLTADAAEFMFSGLTSSDPTADVGYVGFAPSSAVWSSGLRHLVDVQAPRDFTALNIFAWVKVAPGGSETWDIDLDDSTSNFTCQISASGTECNQTAQSHTVSSGTEFSIELTPSGGPPADPTYLAWSIGASM